MPAVEPGKTYVGVTCRKCGQEVPIAEVEEGTTIGRTGGHFDVTCPHCDEAAQYPADALHTMAAQYKH